MESKSQKTLQREEDMEVDSSSSEEEEEFEAKCIVGDRIKNGRKEYLVRWVGYSSDFDSWLNRKNITGKDLIKDYKRRKNNNTIQKSLELSENPPEHKFAKDSLSKCHKSHEIEFIVDRDVSRGKICYLVKLKEHDDFYWEYEENIKDNTLINDYKVRKKNYKLQIKEFDAAIVERQKSNERRRRILEDQQAANEVIEISSDDFL